MKHRQEENEMLAFDAKNSAQTRPAGAVMNASWNAFATLWGIIIAFVTAPVIIHNLGVSQYGILLIVGSITGVLGVVNFGLAEASLRYVAHYWGNRDLAGVNRVFGSTLSFYTAISLALLVVIVPGASLIVSRMKIPVGEHEMVAWCLRLAAIGVSLGMINGAFAAIPRALQRYDISSKFGMGVDFVRSAGYIVLALAGFKIVYLIVLDTLLSFAMLWLWARVARKLLPSLNLLPSFSFKGLREIFGYGIFSFLTYFFHTLYLQAGKLILAAVAGPASVAHLGTPDNVAYRIHMVVASGSETLMPRFSATRDRAMAQSLFQNGTWVSLVISLVFLVPLIVLLPDFLRLWISPEFARESALLGQILALRYISQGAYAPAATFFRGIGKPWMVTVVVLLAGLATAGFSLLLIPKFGVIGVGYAYVLGSIPSLFGVLHCFFYLFGRSAVGRLLRFVGLPVLLSGCAYAIQHAIRGFFVELNWFELFILGGLFVGLSGLLIFGVDWALGGDDTPSKQFLGKLGKSRKLAFIFRFLPLKRAQ
jgi:O-antigen/teichoic acid export membrane protein